MEKSMKKDLMIEMKKFSKRHIEKVTDKQLLKFELN